MKVNRCEFLEAGLLRPLAVHKLTVNDKPVTHSGQDIFMVIWKRCSLSEATRFLLRLTYASPAKNLRANANQGEIWFLTSKKRGLHLGRNPLDNGSVQGRGSGFQHNDARAVAVAVRIVVRA